MRFIAMSRDRYVETHRWQEEHIRQGLREANARKFAPKAEVKKVMDLLRRRPSTDK